MSKPGSIRALLLFAGLTTAQNECYAAANKRVGSSVIPCGILNGDSHSACCYSGDLCLSDSACWDPGSNVTYLYGCTDSTYGDAVCPRKCGAAFDDYWWVGIMHCSTTSDNQWACNRPVEISQEIAAIPPEECDSDNALAFAGPAVLQPILSLPVEAGGETEYFTRVNPTSYSLDPEYTPSALTVETSASVPTSIEYVSITVSATESSSSSVRSSGSVSSSSSVGKEPTAAAATTTSATTEPTASSSSSGLGTGAKAGIGVGVAAGILIPIGIFALFCIQRRRRMKRQISPPDPAPTMKHTYEPPSGPLARYNQKEPSELPGTQTSPVEAGQQQPLLGVGESMRWSNTPTVSSWSSPGMTKAQSRSSVSPVPRQGAVSPLAGAAREREGVHELG